MRGVRERLLHRTVPGRTGAGLAYVGELHGGVLVHKMDHLVCFLPGALLRAARDPPCYVKHKH